MLAATQENQENLVFPTNPSMLIVRLCFLMFDHFAWHNFKGCISHLWKPRSPISQWWNPSQIYTCIFSSYPSVHHNICWPKCPDCLSRVLHSNIMHRVQRAIDRNIMSPRSMNVVFTRIDFAIQQGLVVQLVSCLPSTYSCVILCMYMCVCV